MLIILRDAVRFRRFLKYDWSENWRVSFFSHFKKSCIMWHLRVICHGIFLAAPHVQAEPGRAGFNYYLSPKCNELQKRLQSLSPPPLLPPPPPFFCAITSQSWSWRLWRWHHPCSGPKQGFSGSLVTLITSVIILAFLQIHTHEFIQNKSRV